MVILTGDFDLNEFFIAVILSVVISPAGLLQDMRVATISIDGGSRLDLFSKASIICNEGVIPNFNIFSVVASPTVIMKESDEICFKTFSLVTWLSGRRIPNGVFN